MSHKKIRLHYKKERVVLSDILPYEIPMLFSNRHFYHFLITNRIEFKDGNICWKNTGKIIAIDSIVGLIFGINKNDFTTVELNDILDYKTFKHIEEKKKEQKPEFISIPFDFKISHKETEYRALSICHPRNQLQIVDFYDQYKELILYYCNLSPFSIRKPQRIAKFTFHKDKTHYDNKSNAPSIVEENSKEYENLRSFFVYKDFSNVYKFYESYKFHRCEKKYNSLLKLDISKCFDSIYTHSISWALLSKESVKEKISESNNTFAGLFDKLMQQLNYNETNGIIIGPEFSRIFAELILQSVDRDLLLILEEKELHHKIDYEIFRYVDDYFIFYNDEPTKNHILENLQHRLKYYKLYLNVSKQVLYEKPIITEITIAKNKIKQLLNDSLVFEIAEIKNEMESGAKCKGKIKIRSNPLITQFKTIIKECNVDYKDMLNYTLSIIESKSESILANYLKSDKNEEQLLRAIIGMLEFVFFIYAVSPRVNTTIRLCRILSVYLNFIKSENFIINIDALYNTIHENIRFVLSKNRLQENTQIETIYLLLALAELGIDYELDEENLCSYFKITSNGGDLSAKTEFNYFVICILLFYIKNKPKYSNLRRFIKDKIREKFINNKSVKLKNTEMVLLLMDCLSCPFLPPDFKKELLIIYDITDNNLQENIINSRLQWFTNWKNFNFKFELDAKRSKEVY